MEYLFYDTCSLLNQNLKLLEEKEHFFISNITLKELQDIKTSARKDAEIKYQAHKVIRFLKTNKEKYTILNYSKELDKELAETPILMDNNDSRIILTALDFQRKNPLQTLSFVTHDLSCSNIAENMGLKIALQVEETSSYTGTVEIQYQNDDELADIYEKIYDKVNNPFNLLINQYLLIRDPQNKIIDQYKYTKEGYIRTPDFISFESDMFGQIKPKDKYQLVAMDSLKNNKITMLRGAAGTGKSYLAMGYLFNQMERGKIDKIVIFCNTVATNGSAKLGLDGIRLK